MGPSSSSRSSAPNSNFIPLYPSPHPQQTQSSLSSQSLPFSSSSSLYPISYLQSQSSHQPFNLTCDNGSLPYSSNSKGTPLRWPFVQLMPANLVIPISNFPFGNAHSLSNSNSECFNNPLSGSSKSDKEDSIVPKTSELYMHSHTFAVSDNGNVNSNQVNKSIFKDFSSSLRTINDGSHLNEDYKYPNYLAKFSSISAPTMTNPITMPSTSIASPFPSCPTIYSPPLSQSYNSSSLPLTQYDRQRMITASPSSLSSSSSSSVSPVCLNQSSILSASPSLFQDSFTTGTIEFGESSYHDNTLSSDIDQMEPLVSNSNAYFSNIEKCSQQARRRAQHILIERKRRDKINFFIHQLSRHLPSIYSSENLKSCDVRGDSENNSNSNGISNASSRRAGMYNKGLILENTLSYLEKIEKLLLKFAIHTQGMEKMSSEKANSCETDKDEKSSFFFRPFGSGSNNSLKLEKDDTIVLGHLKRHFSICTNN